MFRLKPDGIAQQPPKHQIPSARFQAASLCGLCDLEFRTWYFRLTPADHHSFLGSPLSRLFMPRYSTIDEVLASYPDRFRADKAEDVDAVVYMNLTGDNARDILLTVKDQTLAMEDGSAVDATLTLIADAENWLAIENGELKPMMAMMQGKLKLKGKPAFAMKFMALFGYAG